jgi:signal transduction histidine kinase
MRTQSLTRVLTGGVLVANIVCSASFSVVATIHEMHGRRRPFDIMLRGRADSLLAALRTAPDSAHGMAINQAATSAGDLYEVLQGPDNAVARTANATPQVLAAFKDNPAAEYFDFRWNGEDYRVLRRQADGPPPGLQVVYASSTADLHHEAVEAAQYYATASFALLLLLTLLSMWFLRSRLLPLNELAQRAGMVSSASWEFEPPQAALRIRELQPIAVSIKKLVQGLKLSFERQREFTGNAAHELKTSIALLKSSLQLLSMRQRSAEEYEKGIAELGIDIRRMEDLTQQMLTLARLEEESVNPSQMVDLSAIVRSVALRLEPFSALKHVLVCVDVAKSQPARIREEDAEILCSNLMMNALQHSPAEAALTVSVASRSNMAELRVSDCGDGIPAAALPRVFDRFYRVDTSRSRQSGGTGLGLAMCKAIVERSGGTIEIESELGKGTDVIVRFPARPTN